MDISLTVNGLDELRAIWSQVPDIAREELFAATLEGELLLEREIKELTPVGVTGLLRSSISHYEPRVLADQVIGEVGTSIGHALPVELGTKPHFPPLAPLIDWVRQKLDIKGSEAYGVAKLIQYKIGSRGTQAVGMFHRAFNDNRGQVNRMYERAHGRIVERLGGG